jgi:hypothetical protein
MGNSASSAQREKATVNDGDEGKAANPDPNDHNHHLHHRRRQPQLDRAAAPIPPPPNDARPPRLRTLPTRHPLLAQHSAQRPPLPSSSTSSSSSRDRAPTMGHSQSRPAPPPPSAGEKLPLSPPPVRSPAGSQPLADAASKKSDPLLPIGPPIPNLDEDSYLLPTAAAEFTRPPRLPLPIQGKVYTPGSPLISAADLTIPLGPLEAGFPALGSY